jgi:hypothetical protein
MIEIDMEGLQVAYLDDSGQIEHYLDRESGDVIDIHKSDGRSTGILRNEPGRYLRIPQRDEQSEEADRLAFIESMEDPEMKAQLVVSLSAHAPVQEFRRALALDRQVERAWYSFKNDRAIQAIERWLREIDLG